MSAHDLFRDLTAPDAPPQSFTNAKGRTVGPYAPLDIDVIAHERAGLHQKYRCHNLQLIDGQLVRCSLRRVAVCFGCAELYRMDWRTIAYDGVFGADRQLLDEFDFFVLTLTALSFGPVHSVTEERKRCRCGLIHNPETDQAYMGQPVDVEKYGKSDAMRWNLGSPRLLDQLHKRIRTAFSISPAEYSFIGAKEPQKRMSLHFHIVLRIPKGKVTDKKQIDRIIQSCEVLDHGTTKTKAAKKRKRIRFGEQSYIDWLTEETRFGPAQGHARVIAYILKAINYTTKDATGTELMPVGANLDDPAWAERVKFLEALERAAKNARCHKCRLIPCSRRNQCPDCAQRGRWNPECPTVLHDPRREQCADGNPCSTHEHIGAVDYCKGYPVECTATVHQNYGIPQAPLLISTGRGAWSLSGYTRKMLRERRTEWVEENIIRPAEDRLREVTGVDTFTLEDWFAAQRIYAADVEAGFLEPADLLLETFGITEEEAIDASSAQANVIEQYGPELLEDYGALMQAVYITWRDETNEALYELEDHQVTIAQAQEKLQAHDGTPIADYGVHLYRQKQMERGIRQNEKAAEAGGDS